MGGHAHSNTPAVLRSALALSLTLGLGGCTLAKLWDFPLGECTTNAECRVLGDPSQPESCQEYICQRDDTQDRNVCVLVTVEEVCDGGDNDCDGLIDERSAGQPVIGQTQVNLRAGNVSALTAASGSPEIIAWTEGGNPFVGRLDMRDGVGGGTLMAEEPAFVTHMTATTVTETLTNPAMDACYRGASVGVSMDCGRGDVALASDGDHVVYAHVAQGGCVGGQLRVSVATAGSPETLYGTGPERRSNSFRGVRPHPSVPFCSVNSTTACTNGDPSVQAACGLGNPALALRDGVGLLTYLSAPVGRSDCGDGSSVDVEAFGLYVRPQPAAAQLAPRVELTDEGSPETLGSTRSGTPPSVAALGDVGFLVAFPDESGDIAVYYVPTPPEPPSNVGTYIDGMVTERPPEVQTEPLEAVRLLGTLPGDAAANAVAMALEETTSDATSVQLGVAWRSSCDETSVLRFQSATLSLDGEGDPTAFTAGEAVRLSAAGLFSRPEVQFAPSGFLTEDAQRGGVTVGPRGGGWYVAWVGQDATATPQTPSPLDNAGALYVERVALFDGLPLESAGPVQVTTDGVAVHQLVRQDPTSGAEAVRVTVRAASSAGVLGIPLSCE